MIVVTPTDAWLAGVVLNCRSSLRVASPFVNSYLPERLGDLRAEVKLELLTRTRLEDFAGGASSLDAVVELSRRAGGILSTPSLHAKVYLADEHVALITSANATHAGMRRNRECGFETKETQWLRELAAQFKSGFGDKNAPSRWSERELEGLREPVELLRKRRAAQVPGLTPHAEEDAPSISRDDFENLAPTLTGWLRMTFEGVLALDRASFTLDQIYREVERVASRRYPANRHRREKLRQQLQRLRDMGLIRFTGKGNYEVIVTAS